MLIFPEVQIYFLGVESMRRSVVRDYPLPGARHVSKRLFPDRQTQSAIHTQALMIFGQFVDHDITHTAITEVEKDDGE